MTGPRVEGGTLVATLYGADNPVDSFTYQWFRTLDILAPPILIVGETVREFRMDIGQNANVMISAEISYTDNENIVQTITSAWTGPIEPH